MLRLFAGWVAAVACLSPPTSAAGDEFGAPPSPAPAPARTSSTVTPSILVVTATTGQPLLRGGSPPDAPRSREVPWLPLGLGLAFAAAGGVSQGLAFDAESRRDGARSASFATDVAPVFDALQADVRSAESSRSALQAIAVASLGLAATALVWAALDAVFAEP